MAELINLNRVRKAKRRDDEKQQAEANRVRFGRTKAEKQRDQAASEKQAALLDGHKLDQDDPDGGAV